MPKILIMNDFIFVFIWHLEMQTWRETMLPRKIGKISKKPFLICKVKCSGWYDDFWKKSIFGKKINFREKSFFMDFGFFFGKKVRKPFKTIQKIWENWEFTYFFAKKKSKNLEERILGKFGCKSKNTSENWKSLVLIKNQKFSPAISVGLCDTEKIKMRKMDWFFKFGIFFNIMSSRILDHGEIFLPAEKIMSSRTLNVEDKFFFIIKNHCNQYQILF